jgi:hypothetical protein
MITTIALALALAAPPTADDARFVTAMLASALAESPRVDVITKEDLRQAMNLEAERQQLGCNESACLAEVAAAMGARLVIYGSLGTFDDVIALELSAFDGETASPLGRSVLQATSLKALSEQAAVKVRSLRDNALAKVGGEGRLRVLVLDLELRNATTPTGTPAEPPPPLSPWTMAAMGTGGLAALSLVVGIGADVVAVQARNEADARNPDGTFVLKSADAAAKYETEAFGAAFALGGYIGAGVLVAATAGLIAVDAME